MLRALYHDVAAAWLLQVCVLQLHENSMSCLQHSIWTRQWVCYELEMFESAMYYLVQSV